MSARWSHHHLENSAPMVTCEEAAGEPRGPLATAQADHVPGEGAAGQATGDLDSENHPDGEADPRSR